MTKAELIKYISLRFPGMLSRDVHALVNVVFNEIAHALIQKRRVELRGFGAFSLRARKAREARNPRTSEVVKLKERYAPYFRAGKELKELINSERGICESKIL